MNKCFKCGTEFDGVFCPQCGTKYEKEKTCPNCQSVVDVSVKFCNYCGYRFEQSVATATDVNQTKTKYNQNTDTVSNPFPFCNVLAKILPQLSISAFALFSILLWAFFAAPIASIFGESLGNVYATLNGIIDDYLPIAQTSLAFAVISIIYATATIALSFIPKTANTTVGKFKLTQILTVCGNLLYIPFFALGCAIVAKSKDIGTENGSCSDLLIAFSIVFAVISVGSLIADLLLRRHMADYEKAISIINQAKAEREERRCQIKAERRAKAVQSLAEKGITEPLNVERPNKKLSIAIAKAYKYNVFAWAISIFAMIVPPVILVFCGLSYYDDTNEQIFVMVMQFINLVLWSSVLWFFMFNFKKYVNNQTKTAVAIVLTIVLILSTVIYSVYCYLFSDLEGIERILQFVLSHALVGSIMTLIYLLSVSNNMVDEGYLQDKTIKKFKTYSIVNLTLSIIIMFKGIYIVWILEEEFISILIQIAFGIIPIILFAVNIARCNTINKAFGINGKKASKLQVVNSEQGEKSLLTLDIFCEQLQNYDLYCENKRFYNASVNRVIRNRALTDKGEYLKRSKTRKTLTALLLAVTILTVGIIGSVTDAKNIFKISRVSQIDYEESFYNRYRTSKAQVASILGEADIETDYVWTYYSSNYLNKLNEIEKLNEQMANVQSIEQAIKIQEKIDKVKKAMENMEYKYIIVTFDDKELATNVKYDFHYNPSKNAAAQ